MANPYHNQILIGDTFTELKKLPDELVDLGITSPPYNKQEKQKGWLVQNVKYDAMRDIQTEEDYQQNQIEVLNELYRVTKSGGSFFYNHKTRWNQGAMIHPMEWLLKSKWSVKQEIIWDRMIAANIRGWRFWQIDERIYWLYKPCNNQKIGRELKSKHALLTSIWRLSPERDNPHPAPFPLALPARIIYAILDEEQGLVIDPYAGSGSTLVASKLLNQKYLGIEISQNYVSMAQERLSHAEDERSKILEEQEKHVVRKTFQDRKNNKEFTGKYQSQPQTQQTLF